MAIILRLRSTATRVVVLTAAFPPSHFPIRTGPGNVTAEGPEGPVVLGETVSLNCTASGAVDPNATLTFKWTQVGNDTVLNADPLSGDVEVTLTAAEQYGAYLCTVYGSNGTTSEGTVEIVRASESTPWTQVHHR